MRVLAIGDVIGRPGRSMLRQVLPNLFQKEKIDFVIANGENAAGGTGITREVAEELFALGVDVLTSGNHVWDKKEAFSLAETESRLLRPYNYPPGAPGRGAGVFVARNGQKIAILNLNGRVFFGPHFDCPFRKADEALADLTRETNVVVLDFHAEATSEKMAMGWYLDGRVSAVLGTHTHVQTADDIVLPGGTAFISDLGMTGPVFSVIGIKKDLVLRRFLTQLPVKFDVASGPRQFCGALLEVDEATGRASSIQRIYVRESA